MATEVGTAALFKAARVAGRPGSKIQRGVGISPEGYYPCGLRRTLIAHFSSPFMRDEVKVEDQRKLCESPFECEVYDHLTERGFVATPQVRVGQYRIDIVVEGENDARLAIECDGDRYHGPDRWNEDMQRQRVLERAGWVFWRCFASAWIRRSDQLSQELLTVLHKLGIEPNPEGARPKSIYIEQRRVCSTDESPATLTSGGMALSSSGSIQSWR